MKSDNESILIRAGENLASALETLLSDDYYNADPKDKAFLEVQALTTLKTNLHAVKCIKNKASH